MPRGMPRGMPLIWGSDYNFTNYNFEHKTTWSSKENIEFHPSGKIYVKQSMLFSEIIVGEIVAKSPYEPLSFSLSRGQAPT